jgi:hypothetical protein
VYAAAKQGDTEALRAALLSDPAEPPPELDTFVTDPGAACGGSSAQPALTALHRAALGNHCVALALLLEAGADPTLKTGRCAAAPSMACKVAYELARDKAARNVSHNDVLLRRRARQVPATAPQ